MLKKNILFTVLISLFIGAYGSSRLMTRLIAGQSQLSSRLLQQKRFVHIKNYSGQPVKLYDHSFLDYRDSFYKTSFRLDSFEEITMTNIKSFKVKYDDKEIVGNAIKIDDATDNSRIILHDLDFSDKKSKYSRTEFDILKRKELLQSLIKETGTAECICLNINTLVEKTKYLDDEDIKRLVNFTVDWTWQLKLGKESKSVCLNNARFDRGLEILNQYKESIKAKNKNEYGYFKYLLSLCH